MFSLIKNITSPILSLILFVISSAFFTTFVSVFSKNQGLDQTTIGYFHSAFYFGYLVGSAKVEHLIRRVGHIRAFSAFSSINAAIILILAILPIGKELWIVARFINGLCMASLFIVIESWLIGKSTVKTRGQILGVYMFVLYASQSISQLIIRYIDINNLMPFLLTGLLASLSIFPLSITKTSSPEIENPTLTNVFKILKISPLGSMSCFLSGCILSSIYSFTPNFAQEYNLSISNIMSITIAGGFILQWPIGKLSDIFSRKKIIAIVAFVAIVPSLGIMIFHNFEAVVLSLSFMLGGLVFTIYPLGIAQTCDQVDAHNTHSAIGMLSLLYGVGATLGPLMAPLITKPLGYNALYLYISISCLALFASGLYSVLKRPSISVEDQNNYVSVFPKASPTSSDLDPRNQG